MRPFPLGEEIDLLRDTVHAFAEKEIAPRATHISFRNEFRRCAAIAAHRRFFIDCRITRSARRRHPVRVTARASCR